MKCGKVPGTNNGIEKKFKLVAHKYEEYKGLCFGNGDCVLVVDVWLHRVDEDVSGLTFEEWDPSVDTDPSEAPVAIIVNSSEMCATGFDLREVIPLELESLSSMDCCYEFFLINQLLIRPSCYQPTVDRGGSVDDS